MLQRLQKILSERGIASRRKSEEYIEAGLVKVNGVVATLGQKADPLNDKIEVDGKVLFDRAEMLYYVMNKPVGVETTNVARSLVHSLRAPHKRETRNEQTSNECTVRDILPANLRGKIYPVGRLDKDSSGLLLFTNDGVLSYRLTHPKFDHEKEYEVTVDRPITPMTLRQIEEGFIMDGHKTKPLECRKIAPTRARVVLTEGKNRQIRRMFQQCGYTVVDLKRVRIMTLQDEDLSLGETRVLTEKEKKLLLDSVNLHSSVQSSLRK